MLVTQMRLFLIKPFLPSCHLYLIFFVVLWNTLTKASYTRKSVFFGLLSSPPSSWGSMAPGRHGIAARTAESSHHQSQAESTEQKLTTAQFFKLSKPTSSNTSSNKATAPMSPPNRATSWRPILQFPESVCVKEGTFHSNAGTIIAPGA